MATTDKARGRILIVDDERNILSSLSGLLRLIVLSREIRQILPDHGIDGRILLGCALPDRGEHVVVHAEGIFFMYTLYV